MFINHEILKSLGLSATEVKVYTTLLPLGSVPASAVATRLKMPRPTIKYNCEQLEKKGLVTAYLRNNTFYYLAKDPEVLHSLLTAEKKALERKENDLSQTMGVLKQLFNTEAKLPKVQFFEGADNINAVLQDALDSRQPIYGCLYMTEDFHPTVMDYINNVYIPERKRTKIKTRSIFNDNPITKEYRQLDKSMNRVSLLIPYDQFPLDLCYHIYGDKVAFFSYKTDHLMGLIIEDQYVRNMQFSLFKMAWAYARTLEINSVYRKMELD